MADELDPNDIDTDDIDTTDADDTDPIDSDTDPGDQIGADDFGGDDDDGGDDLDDIEDKVFDAKYVRKLRRENARARREAREAAARAAEEAAERAREEFAQDLFGALGLADEEEYVDPDELIELARKEATEATNRLREYEIKDAITTAAANANADIDLLVPYLRGRGLIDDLDPEDEGFEDVVADLVEAAVARNPKLRADAPVARRSSGDMSAGSGEPKKKKPRTIDDIRKERRAHRERKFGVVF